MLTSQGIYCFRLDGGHEGNVPLFGLFHHHHLPNGREIVWNPHSSNSEARIRQNSKASKLPLNELGAKRILQLFMRFMARCCQDARDVLGLLFRWPAIFSHLRKPCSNQDQTDSCPAILLPDPWREPSCLRSYGEKRGPVQLLVLVMNAQQNPSC